MLLLRNANVEVQDVVISSLICTLLQIFTVKDAHIRAISAENKSVKSGVFIFTVSVGDI